MKKIKVFKKLSIYDILYIICVFLTFPVILFSHNLNRLLYLSIRVIGLTVLVILHALSCREDRKEKEAHEQEQDKPL